MYVDLVSHDMVRFGHNVTKSGFQKHSTRTTRMPAFWDTFRCPMITHTSDSQFHIRSQVKTRQSQSYKFKKNAKNLNFDILQETLHATHLLKLLDKMYKYEMDPTRTVGVTERTDRFHKYSVTHLTQWRRDIYLWWQVVQVNMDMLMAMVCQNYQASA